MAMTAAIADKEIGVLTEGAAGRLPWNSWRLSHFRGQDTVRRMYIEAMSEPPIYPRISASLADAERSAMRTALSGAKLDQSLEILTEALLNAVDGCVSATLSAGHLNAPWAAFACNGRSGTTRLVQPLHGDDGQAIGLLELVLDGPSPAPETLAPLIETATLIIARDRDAVRSASKPDFEAIVEHMPVLCGLVDPDGQAFWFNRRWYECVGGTPEMSHGYGWQNFLTPDIRDGIARRYAQGIAAGHGFDLLLELVDAGGGRHTLLTQITPLHGSDGAIVSWLGTAADISEMEELRRTEALHDLILDSATDFAIITMSPRGQIMTWNRGATEIFAWTPEEAIGNPIGLIFPDELRTAGRPDALFATALANGHAVNEGEHVRRDGTRIWVSGTTRVMLDAEGQHVGFLKIVRDRTEQRRHEEHRRLLVAELNHRVKNTLAIVRGIASQTLKEGGARMQAAEALEGRLMALASAHDLLTRESWEAANLADLVREVSGIHAVGNRLTSGGPPIRLNPKTAVAISMALHELFTNARKYGSLSSDNGQIAISWTREGDKFHLRWKERGGPPAMEPQRKGFGLRLIETTLRSDMDGKVKLEFGECGLVCEMAATLREAAGDD